MSAGGFAFDFFMRWMERRREKRQRRKRAREAAGGEFLPEEPVTMDALRGALRSKLVWLGIVQAAAGLFELYANGTLTAESAWPIVFGALTIAGRAVTTESLADKVK